MHRVGVDPSSTGPAPKLKSLPPPPPSGRLGAHGGPSTLPQTILNSSGVTKPKPIINNATNKLSSSASPRGGTIPINSSPRKELGPSIRPNVGSAVCKENRDSINKEIGPSLIPSRSGSNLLSRNTYDCKIAGLYDLEETLGRGHFAVVKLARHVFTGEKVAVKVIDKAKLDEVSRAHLFQASSTLFCF